MINSVKLKEIFFEDVDFAGMRSEVIGTTIIVYCCGWVFTHLFLELNGIEEVFLSVAIVYTIFTWSGSRKNCTTFNPAISLTLGIFRRNSWVNTLYFIICQLVASILGSSVLKMLSPNAQLAKVKKSGFLGFPRLPADTHTL